MSKEQDSPTLSGILFDFNGTLFFDTYMHTEVFRRNIFKLFGKPLPDGDFDDYMVKNLLGRNSEAILKSFFKPDATEEECREFTVKKDNFYFEECLANPERMKLAPHAEELLDHIKKTGIPYCMATGSGKREVDFFIEHLGLDRWFSYDNIVYTDGTFNGKPYPDCYLLAAKRLSLDPQNCLVFEDGAPGIKAANAANAGAVIVVHESTLPSPLSQDLRVDGVYHDFSNWESILKKYNLAR